MKLAIMQGRLSPIEDGRFQSFPRLSWEREFERVAAAGLQGIEWIYDVYGEGANPIETDDGIAQIKALSRQHGVEVRSLCADWFMENLLFRIPSNERQKNIERFHWLLERCRQAGIGHVVLPFVDTSSMRDEAEREAVAEMLQTSRLQLQKCGVEVHLETDLGPSEFAGLLEAVSSPLIKANYDTGNSAASGYRASEEWAAYGYRVGSVHFKDRIRNGGTVPLGEGNVDWPDVFGAMQSYRGPMLLQVARGEAGQETQWAQQNRIWMETTADLHGFRTH